MALDLYKPSFLAGVVEQIPPVRRFLKDTFFRQTQRFYTESVKFDIVKNGMPMAPFVSPRIGGTVLEREGFKTVEFTPALVAPKRMLTVDDLDIRLPGESPINGYHPRRRQAELIQRDLIALDNAITRREEWMAAQALYNGKIIVVGVGVNSVVDFEFENNIVVEVPWTDVQNSDPMADIADACDQIAGSGHSPDIMIATSKTIRLMLRNEKLKEFFDNSGFRVGVIEPEVLKHGGRYYGFLREAGVDIYSYDGRFADNDNENPDYPGVAPGDRDFIAKSYTLVPEGKVFIGSTQMPAEMLYGVVKNIRNGHSAMPRVAHTWDNDEGTVRQIKLSSRPLPCPLDVSSWAILDVLGEEDD